MLICGMDAGQEIGRRSSHPWDEPIPNRGVHDGKLYLERAVPSGAEWNAGHQGQKLNLACNSMMRPPRAPWAWPKFGLLVVPSKLIVLLILVGLRFNLLKML